MTSPLTHLGDMPVEEFLRDYWQKKPLLIRNAFPGFQSPLDGDELAGLALEEEVESRIVLEHGKTPWELRNGPFDEDTFGTLPESHWTLLVQAVDQWVPEVHELLHHFRFIPSWRLDDIMISYAPDQGSVGPHFDYYDVFLLQGMGKRRWKLGQMCDSESPRVEGTRLNILSQFDTTDEWVVEPGDLLYIPPGIAHWGVAEGDCMTYSIGFRAPTQSDIIAELGQEISLGLSNDQRYADPDLALQENPGEIKASAITKVHEIMTSQLTPANIALWMGKYMTERKYGSDEIDPEQAIDASEWQEALADGEMLWRHPAARLAYHKLDSGETFLFADGQAFCCSLGLAELLCKEVEVSWREIKPFAENDDDRATITQLINQDTLLVDE